MEKYMISKEGKREKRNLKSKNKNKLSNLR